MNPWTYCETKLPLQGTDPENWCWVCLEDELDVVRLVRFSPQIGWLVPEGRKVICWKHANKPETPTIEELNPQIFGEEEKIKLFVR
jgi:hypothetical protein